MMASGLQGQVLIRSVENNIIRVQVSILNYKEEQQSKCLS